jgi:dihydroorotase
LIWPGDLARTLGVDVTTEAYPYEAGMTGIESALFDGWETWDDDRFPIHQWAATGERLSRSSFARYHEQGGLVIIHDRTEEMTRAAVESPLTMIASDGLIDGGRGHPRTSGTYAKVLGKYVREEGVLTLMEALQKMTIEPARRLEGYVAIMKSKGRLEVSADADITIFDATTVIDRSTYTDPTIPSEGIEFVLVNGVVVVDDGELVTDVKPGRPIKAR